jgi:hypothetical protein
VKAFGLATGSIVEQPESKKENGSSLREDGREKKKTGR